MLLPTGNPQNLYLYGKAGISLGRFVLLMMPYTLLSFLLLFVWSMRAGKTVHCGSALVKGEFVRPKAYPLTAYPVLFFLCLLAVGRILPWQAVFVVIIGREAYVSVLSSQIISNVPAALLLSGFSDHYSELIVGTNPGGLGTLIASMASLILYNLIDRKSSF